jgi:cytochrome c biogenesis protein ResB
MLIIRNNFLPFKGFVMLNILGVVFVRGDAEVTSWRARHEAIHTAQQYEIMTLSALVALVLCQVWASWWYLLIVVVMPFALYLLAWLIALALPPYDRAYHDTPFEREAYANEFNSDYLTYRKLFAWVRYLKLKEL